MPDHTRRLRLFAFAALASVALSRGALDEAANLFEVGLLVARRVLKLDGGGANLPCHRDRSIRGEVASVERQSDGGVDFVDYPRPPAVPFDILCVSASHAR